MKKNKKWIKQKVSRIHHIQQKYLSIQGASQQTIIDQTETNLVTLRRTIYLTIQSSVGAEECEFKLLNINLRPGEEVYFNKKKIVLLF